MGNRRKRMQARQAEAERRRSTRQNLTAALVVVVILSGVAVVVSGGRPTRPTEAVAPVSDQPPAPLDLDVAQTEGIEWAKLTPLTDAEAAPGLTHDFEMDDPLPGRTTTELMAMIRRAAPNDARVLDLLDGFDWVRATQPSLERRFAVTIVPQIHQPGAIDVRRGDIPNQLAVEAQREIGRYLLNRAGHGRFAILTEGPPLERVNLDNLNELLIRAGERDWDRTMLAWQAGILFGLTHPDYPMWGEGPSIDKVTILWPGQTDQEILRSPLWVPVNHLRDRLVAARATKLAAETKLPVIAVFGTAHACGIQDQLRAWGVKNKIWISPTVYASSTKPSPK